MKLLLLIFFVYAVNEIVKYFTAIDKNKKKDVIDVEYEEVE